MILVVIIIVQSLIIDALLVISCWALEKKQEDREENKR